MAALANDVLEAVFDSNAESESESESETAHESDDDTGGDVFDDDGRESDENEDEVPEIGREEELQSSTTWKCKRDPSQWTRNANKLKRARGEYVNRNRQVVPARTVGHSCNCKRKCSEKIGDEKIKTIFEGFLQLSDKDKQDSYLFSLITCNPVKR